MKAIVCDRCGKTEKIEGSFVSLTSMIIQNGEDVTPVAATIDLCEDCRKDFAEWIASSKEKSNEENKHN